MHAVAVAGEARESADAQAPCACPQMAGNGKVLVLHTLACLRRRRGQRSLAAHYGRPAERRR
jgi:hypothetical protein